MPHPPTTHVSLLHGGSGVHSTFLGEVKYCHLQRGGFHARALGRTANTQVRRALWLNEVIYSFQQVSRGVWGESASLACGTLSRQQRQTCTVVGVLLGGGVPGALEDCQGHETFEPCLWGMLPTCQGRGSGKEYSRERSCGHRGREGHFAFGGRVTFG